NGIVAFHETGQVVEFNAAAERMFRYSAADVLGHSLWELIPTLRWESAGKNPGPVSETLAPGKRFETYAARGDGSQFPAEVSIATFQQEGRVMFSASIRDLSERVEAETMRQENEAKSRFVAA